MRVPSASPEAAVKNVRRLQIMERPLSGRMVALRLDERPSSFQGSRRAPDTASKQGTETTFAPVAA